MDELKKLLIIPKERLVQHGNNREEDQKQAKEIRAQSKEESHSSEAKDNMEIREAHEETEGRILSFTGM